MKAMDSKTLHIKASPLWTGQTRPKLNEEVAWDDDAHSKVDEVCLTYTQDRVCSIQASKTLHIKASPVWTGQTQTELNDEVAWDDDAHSKVDEVCLTYTQDRVCSIQVTYSDSCDNAILLSPMHGNEGIMFNQLCANSPIISVSGHYEWLKDTSVNQYDPKNYRNYRVVRSLTFKTASGVTYGPYGLEIGTPFCYQTDNGVVGFHGKLGGRSAESYLSYLGVYVQSYATRAVK